MRVIYGEPMYYTGDKKDKEAMAAFAQSILDRVAAMRTAAGA